MVRSRKYHSTELTLEGFCTVDWNFECKFYTFLKVRLHLQFLLRFLVRFSSSDACERVNKLWMFRVYHPYSKSSLTLTLNEWKFNLSFSRVSLLFLNSWRVSVVPYYVTTHPLAILKQHWHSREAQIEPPLIECERALRIQAYVSLMYPHLNIHNSFTSIRRRKSHLESQPKL
jgi:hypothetical protein